MAKKFLTPLGLVSLSSDPATGSEGQLYFNTTSDVIKIYSNGVWSELTGGGGGSVIYSPEQPDVSSITPGTIWMDSNTEIADIGTVVNLDSYLTIISASSTYATKAELNNINLSSAINTASAAAYSSASAYTNQQISNINLSSAIQTASAAAVSYLVDGAPEALNTLNELAAALDDNADILDLYLTQSSASSTYATKINRWRKTYAASAQLIQGVDDNSNTLSYTAGYELFYLNGILLATNEYTTTSSSLITLNEALSINDVVDIVIGG
jgi:hypothetical protein